MNKKIIPALFLSLALIISYTPVSAYAVDTLQEGKVIDTLEEVSEEIPEEITMLPEGEVLLEEYMFETAEAQISHADASSQGKSTRGSKLKGNDAIAYNYLKTEIEMIAAGQRSSTEIRIPVATFTDGKTAFTAEELGVETIGENTSQGFSLNMDAVDAFWAKCGFNANKVIYSLLFDLPYHLYWYDRNYQIEVGHPYQVISQGGQYKLTIKPYDDPCYPVTFTVAQAFSVNGTENTTTLDTATTAAASTAAVTAGQIVENNTGKSDLAILTAYKDEICERVDYDQEGLDQNPPYGNLWQLIYVFDQDPKTNVVCEGYAKAFQFLCDLTSFESQRIESHIIEGTMLVESSMSSGNHMWNSVHMNDNKNYLVDVTNCDTLKTDELFLKEFYSGDVDSGYRYKAENDYYTFTYNPATLEVYSDEELTMSASDYVECSHTWEKTTETPGTCTEPSIIIMTCSKCTDTRQQKIAPYGHQYPLEHYGYKAATCTEAGNIECWYCDRCKEYFGDADANQKLTDTQRIIPKTGHDSPMAHTAAKEATCTEAGNLEFWYCSKCKEYFGDADANQKLTDTQRIIPMIDHQWNEGEITTKPTYKAAGVKTYRCLKCGHERTEPVKKLTSLTQKVKVKTSTKSVMYKTLKEKSVTVAPITVKGNKGKLSYKLVNGGAKSKKALKLNTRTGKIKVVKYTKKGKYTLKVKVTAAATASKKYKAFNKIVTVTVKVK